MEQRNEDIIRGLWALILVVLALFLAGTAGVNITPGTSDDRGGVVVLHDDISSFNRITLGLPVSINMETEEGLTAVPGIGPVTARSIVEERTSRGGFRSLEELKSVRGIGDKTYNKIITYVTL